MTKHVRKLHAALKTEKNVSVQLTTGSYFRRVFALSATGSRFAGTDQRGLRRMFVLHSGDTITIED